VYTYGVVVTSISSNAPDFQQWMREHPDFVKKHIVKENDKWGRIECKWTEKKEGKTLTHVFSASVDLQTGDVYLDCRKRKLFAKNLALIAGRPLHTAAKTLYHLSLAGVVREIYKASQGTQTKQDAFDHSVKSLKDIYRTPAYGVAMQAVNIAAVAIAPLKPDKLYDLRKMHGNLEQRLNWGEKHTDWTLALCFQSGFNVQGTEYGAIMPVQGAGGLGQNFSRKIADYQMQVSPKLGTLEQKQEEKKKLEEEVATLKTVPSKEKSRAKKSREKKLAETKTKLEGVENKIDELNKEIAKISTSFLTTLDDLKDQQKLYEINGKLSRCRDPKERKLLEQEYNQIYDRIRKRDESLHLDRLHSKEKDTEYSTKYDTKIKELEDQPSSADRDTKLARLKEERDLETRLTHFSRAMIRERRKEWFNPFYQIGKMDPDKAYTSAILPSISDVHQHLQHAKIFLEKADRHLGSMPQDSSHKNDVALTIKNIRWAINRLEKQSQEKGITDQKIQRLIEEGNALIKTLEKTESTPKQST